MTIRTGMTLLFVIGMTWAGLAVANASFPCAKAASEVEKLICESSNVHLMELDRALAREYREALGHAKAPGDLKAEQRGWLLERDKCLAERYTEERHRAYCDQLGLESNNEKWKELDRCAQTRCLARSYRERIKTLTGRCYRDVEWSKWKGEPIRSGHWPLCRTFLDNLNRHCDEAPMVCEWKVHPDIKALRLPEWKRLDEAELAKLYGNKWQQARRDYDTGRIRASHIDLDLDGGDGEAESLVRFEYPECPANPRGAFRTADGEWVSVQNRIKLTEPDLTGIIRGGRNAPPKKALVPYESEAIVLFDGKPYVVGWFYGSGELGQGQIQITQPSSGHFLARDKEGYMYGNSTVCVFEYLGD